MSISVPEFRAFAQSGMLIEPSIVSPDLTVMAAIAVLQQQPEAHSLLVCTAEKLIGIVTQRDILNSIAAQQNPLETTVAQVMVQPVITLSVSQLAQGFAVTQLFEQHGFSQFPIVDEQGKILGLLTRDRLWAFLNKAADLDPELVTGGDRHPTTIALRESENQYAALAEAAPVGIFRANLAGEVIWVNRHWTEITELSFDESLGLKWIQCVHPDWRDRLIESWSKFTREGMSYAVENCFQMKDGRQKWVYCQAQPEKDIYNNTVGYVGTLTEITRQKQLELSLRESEAELASLFAAMQDVVLVFDRQGIYRKVITSSPNLYKPILERIGKSVSSVVPAATAAIVMDCIERTFTTQTIQTCEYALTVNDREIWFAATCSRLTADTVLWVARDISDLHQAEADLRDSEYRYASLMTTVPVGIFRCNLMGKLIYINEQVSAITGLSVEEALPDGWRKSIHPDDYDWVIEAWERIFQDYEILKFECRILHRNGETRWVYVQILPEKDANQQVIGFVGTVTDISDRKQIELELLQQEERWQLALSANNDGIWDWNILEDTIIYSSRCLEILGYTEAEHGKCVADRLELIHPDDRDRAMQTVQDHLTRKTPAYFSEHRVRCKDGHYKWVLDRGKAVWNEQGTPIRMVGSHKDITDRKEAEEKLKRSQASLLEAQQLVHIGSWEFELATQKITWSPELYRMFGLDPNQPEPPYDQYLQQHIHPDDREQLAGCVNQAIAKGEGYVIEYRAVLPDGSLRYHEGKGEIEKDAAGNVIRIFGTAFDITERTLAAQNLRESEIRWQFALEGSGDGIWDWNTETNQVFFSKQWKTMLGYEEEEIGDSLDEWNTRIHPDDKEETYAKIQQHFRGETPVYQSEHRVLCKDGSYKWVLDRGKVIRWTADGQPLRVIGTHSDISDRKQTEQELIKAKEEAEAAALAKSMFLANMSHEIRTPMNGVIGMLNLLQETPLNSIQRSQANIAQSSAESLLSLINDILDFSKVEAGKLDLETIEFDLLEMLNNFAKTIALTAQEKGLELVFDLRGIRQSLVQGDPHRLRQILVNLTSNAIKFTEQGDILIRCELQPTATGLLFTGSVQDSGIGIPVNRLNDLFNPFTQLDASTTRQYGGTGLGLAISTKLCRLMGGDIEAESTIGQGSCFTFRVRLQPSQTPSPFPPPESLGALQVLVVEDNSLQQQVLCDQLRDWGMQVTIANTAQEALRLCNELEDQCLCDRLFVDWSLPDMDSRELGQRLVEKHPHLGRSLIMMTAIHSYNKDIDMQRERGVETYLTKPIMPQELWQMLLNPKEPNQRRSPSIQLSEIPLSKELPIMEHLFSSKHLHLLLVEDNRINQLVMQGLLKKFGLEADIAFNGIEALRLMNGAETPYDLLLMDCLMPEMDGYEVSQRIRQGEAGDRHRGVPIIALTANAMKGDKEKCIQAGMDDYLSKPVHPQQLKALLSKWLIPKQPI